MLRSFLELVEGHEALKVVSVFSMHVSIALCQGQPCLDVWTTLGTKHV
jgi:hypothetical protein